MNDNLPSLTRQDLESVIRRAVQLEAEAGSADPELAETDVLRIAQEVGLSEANVRRALAEHRATSGGLLVERGLASRLCGPGLIMASRSVPRPAAEVQRDLESHFKSNESLRLVRRIGPASLWEPDRGVFASVMRSVDLFGRGYQLAKKSRAIELRVVPIDDDSSQVVLTADLGDERAGWFWGLGVTVGGVATATASASILLLANVPDLVVVATPALLAITIALARAGYRGATNKMQTVLAGMLDRLEHQESLEPLRPSWRDLLK